MLRDNSSGVRSRSFPGTSGGAEHFISIEARGELDLAGQIAQIERRYATTRAALGLAEETAVFRRIFVSDVMNQSARVRTSALVRTTQDSPVAVSLVRQPPASGAKIALLAYHLDDATLGKRRLSKHDLLVEKNGRRHLWTTGLCAGQNDDALASPAAQTRAVFGDLIGALASQGATLRDNCVRTWIYLKDVDVFYRGMAESRGEVFAENGLTGDSHFIASTGIEGACAHRYDVVAMDAYSNIDVEPRQVSYLNDFDRLCATKDYNVTFERATRVAYSDRAHIFISGTASNDSAGEVVHRGDVRRQLDRASENISALLRAGSASLEDLAHLIVYLRDPSDFALIEGRLNEQFAGLPTAIVQGAVCRPEWLVELEGVAIARQAEASMPGF
ncbi:MAG: Rid family hydrolase [Roseiarcus sp.]